MLFGAVGGCDKPQVAGRVVKRMRKALIALTLLLAGCTGAPGDGAVDPPTGGDLDVVLADALALYNAGNTTANLVRLAQLDVGGAEVDACDELLFTDSGNHVDIIDVGDPIAPVVIGTYASPVDIQDVKVSDDCQWLFIGNDEEGSSPPVQDQKLPGTPVGHGGFYVVDVSDPTHPVAKSDLGVGPRRGPHMVTYHKTPGGRELVFGANADVSINEFDRASGTLTELARYAAPLQDFNRDPEVFDAYYQGYAHDMFVMEDPVLNKTLLYVANWDAGLRILDLSDPEAPVELGTWNDFPAGHEGNLHTVATELIGDRRITVGSVEVGFYVVGGYHYVMHTDRSIVYVWDTTDVTAIRLLGQWENPGQLPADRDGPAPVFEASESSTHNFQLEHGRVYLAHYTLGFFVLDVSTPENQTSPQLVAFHKEPGDNVWDVVLNDGIVYTSGGGAGIVALHFPRDVTGPLGIDSRN